MEMNGNEWKWWNQKSWDWHLANPRSRPICGTLGETMKRFWTMSALVCLHCNPFLLRSIKLLRYLPMDKWIKWTGISEESQWKSMEILRFFFGNYSGNSRHLLMARVEKEPKKKKKKKKNTSFPTKICPSRKIGCKTVNEKVDLNRYRKNIYAHFIWPKPDLSKMGASLKILKHTISSIRVF